MNLLGHGVDLISFTRFRELIALVPTEDIYLSRVFQEYEIKHFPTDARRIEHIAGRFAAKESVLKALGTGFGNGISFTDVRIFRESGRPPGVILSGEAEKTASMLGITGWCLSISHSEDMAMASAIAFGDI